MKNLDLLVAVRDKIVNDPKAHDQNHWGVIEVDPQKSLSMGATVSCTTAACVAGWTCQINGDRALLDDTDTHIVELGDGTEIRAYGVVHVVDQNGDQHYIADRARELLGLNKAESDDLFDGDNTTQKVLILLNEHIAEARAEQAATEPAAL